MPIVAEDVFSAKSIYSPEGRLRAIGSAFLEESKHLETQLHLEKVQAAKQSVHSTGEIAMTSMASDAAEASELVLPSGWRMQYLAENVSHDLPWKLLYVGDVLVDTSRIRTCSTGSSPGI